MEHFLAHLEGGRGSLWLSLSLSSIAIHSIVAITPRAMAPSPSCNPFSPAVRQLSYCGAVPVPYGVSLLPRLTIQSHQPPPFAAGRTPDSIRQIWTALRYSYSYSTPGNTRTGTRTRTSTVLACWRGPHGARAGEGRVRARGRCAPGLSWGYPRFRVLT